jgi:hypothetical protein
MVLSILSVALIVAAVIVPYRTKLPRKTRPAGVVLGLGFLALGHIHGAWGTLLSQFLMVIGFSLFWQAWTEWQEQRVIDRGHAAAERGTKPGA